MQDKSEILTQIRTILVEMFELDPDAVQPDANLYDDLDIDSIDAVDLVAHLRTISGKKIDPDDFKSVRTVADVVDVVDKLLNPRR
jgi:acyl carrier protein